MATNTTATNFCVLFADVAGSTRLYELLGPERALEAVQMCLMVVEREVLAGSGRVVKEIGDEIMAVFPDVEQGCLAASRIQKALHEAAPVHGHKMAIRVGFHYGAVVQENNDFFGDAVNVAARMVAQSKSQQIITSEQTATNLPLYLKEVARSLYNVHVKGKSAPMQLVEILWQENNGDQTMMLGGTQRLNKFTPTALTLHHMGETLAIDVGKPLITFGRDKSCHVVIADKMASRTHCRIELRGTKFVLIDQSSNGTFLSYPGEVEIVLRREETMIRGTGNITFGHSYRGVEHECVQFEC